MLDVSWSYDEAVQRLSRRDATLDWINLYGQNYTDSEVVELADCLLAHPNVVTRLDFGINNLTDQTGVKLAQYLAVSSTIRTLGLGCSKFGSATYLAVAAALRVNSSLQVLYLYNNQAVDRTRIDAAFVEALQLNPDRPAESHWQLYMNEDNDFERLKHAAEQLGHPSLQSLLALLC